MSKGWRWRSLRPRLDLAILNLFNRRNERFDSVVTGVGSPDFGTSLQVQGQPRQAQVSARIEF